MATSGRGGAADRGRPKGGGTRLLEREAELDLLSGALESARGGIGALVVIEAPPGLGKSRLLAWSVERASRSGMQVLRGRGSEPENEVSFGVAIQLFDRWFAAASEAEREEALAGAAALSRPLLDPGGAAPADAASLAGRLHGLFWLLSNLAARRPLLVAIDDLHWSDPASVRFLQYLLARIEDLPVAVVATTRPEQPGAGPAEQVALHPSARRLRPAPLSAGAVGRLIADVLGSPAAPRFAEAAAEATGGNPFLLQAVARELLEDDIPPTAANVPRVSELRPEIVRRRLLARVSRLGRDATRLASAAAVLGKDSILARVAAVAELDLDRAAAAADALVAAGVLASATPAAFAHPLHRAALYDELPAAQRARAHLRAAQLLCAEHAPDEEVASQLLHATRVGDPWAYRALRAAAAHALAVGNPLSATHFLDRALREPLQREQRAETLVELARAASMTGHGAAEEHAREALRISGPPRQQAAAWEALGGILFTKGERRAAAEAFSRALELLGDPDDPTARDLHAAYFSAASVDPDLAPGALAHIEPLLDRRPGGETPAERGALAALAAHRALGGGSRREAVELAWRAWGSGALLAAEGPDGSAWSLVTAALAWMDELAGAAEVAAAVIEESRRSGSLMAYATASYCAGVPAHYMGRLSEARAHGEAALAARRQGWSTYATALAGTHSNLLIDQAELAEAERLLDELELDGASAAPAPDQAVALSTRARLRLLRGEPRRALDDSLAAGGLLDAIGGSVPTLAPWRVVAALACLALGDAERAAEFAAQARDVASATGAPTHLARVLRLDARLVDGEEAIALLRKALAGLEGSQALMERLRTRAELGMAVRRSGRRAEAREVLATAREEAHAMGARLLERRIDEEMRVAGARPRRLRFSGPESLTASEKRVAAMASSGMSNREIAQALFVTTRTVEQHLYKAYKKLGISSRGDLPAGLAAAPPRRVSPASRSR